MGASELDGGPRVWLPGSCRAKHVSPSLVQASYSRNMAHACCRLREGVLLKAKRPPLQVTMLLSSKGTIPD